MESQSPVQPPTSSEVNQTPVVPTATAPTSTQPRPEPTPAPSDVAPTAPTVSNTTQNHVSETTEGSLQQPDAVASKTEGEAEVTMPQVLQTLEQLETIHKTLEDEAAGQAEGWGVEGCAFARTTPSHCHLLFVLRSFPSIIIVLSSFIPYSSI